MLLIPSHHNIAEKIQRDSAQCCVSLVVHSTAEKTAQSAENPTLGRSSELSISM